jgi:tetratricopeptide (TPR) repeat protein
LPSGRKRWFRLAAVAAPVLLLILIEAGLRIFGYGHPTGFFLRSQVGGRNVFIENQAVTERYFPKGLARSPQPIVMADPKPADAYRIFIFGESAAMGDPEPAFGFGRMLEVILRAQYPGKTFEVVNVAITAINSHVIREIARDCAGKEGDLWIIYLGNNEVVGPFGAGTVFGQQAPGRPVVRATIALKATRLGQLLDDLKQHLSGASGLPATWEGMEMFVKQQIRQDDPRMAVVYDHFQKNLDDILRRGESAGARVLVSTVVSNLKDCPPFASLHRPDLSVAQRDEWRKLYDAGSELESATNHAAAIDVLQKALLLDDHHAATHFRLGRCFMALGKYELARQSFQKARDLDALRFRADTRINEILRQVAAKRSRVTFVDAVGTFAQNSPHEITGEEFLYEHVHLNFAGNYLLARTLAGEIAGLLPAQVTGAKTNPAPPLSAEECARRLALTEWDRLQVTDEMIRRLQKPPFTGQLDHEARDQWWQKQRAELQSWARAPRVGEAMETYRRALALAPDDWVLHENFARMLQESGESAAAEAQWRRVIELRPHYAPAYYSLGNVLDAQNRNAEAQICFQQALQRRPDSHEARNGLGLVLSSQGKAAEARLEYENALRRKPDFVEARINLGQLLASQGKADEARSQYLTALRYNSNSVAAHINLGKLLADAKDFTGAASHYEQALRLRPDHAVAHFNLGNALAGLARPEALAHYQEAVRLSPDFAEARHNLALELARRGRNAQALGEFAEAVRLKPTFADGHLNFGVALAKERRFDEAIEQFREALRLDPGNPTAQKFLDQAMAIQGRKQ